MSDPLQDLHQVASKAAKYLIKLKEKPGFPYFKEIEQNIYVCELILAVTDYHQALYINGSTRKAFKQFNFREPTTKPEDLKKVAEAYSYERVKQKILKNARQATYHTLGFHSPNLIREISERIYEDPDYEHGFNKIQEFLKILADKHQEHKDPTDLKNMPPFKMSIEDWMATPMMAEGQSWKQYEDYWNRLLEKEIRNKLKITEMKIKKHKEGQEVKKEKPKPRADREEYSPKPQPKRPRGNEDVKILKEVNPLLESTQKLESAMYDHRRRIIEVIRREVDPLNHKMDALDREVAGLRVLLRDIRDLMLREPTYTVPSSQGYQQGYYTG